LNFALLVEKKLHVGRPTRKPHVATSNDHATQLRYNIDERVAELSHYSNKRYNVDGL
jgi:hypothetical protein